MRIKTAPNLNIDTRLIRNRIQLRKAVIAAIGCGIFVAAIIIAVTVQYYSLSKLQEVQFGPNSVGNFDVNALTLDVQVDACNPTDFPTSFDRMVFELNYRSMEFATMTLFGDTLAPNQAVTLNGKIHINADTAENWWQAYNVFTGYNHNDVSLKVFVKTKILGVMPVTVNRDFTYDQFVALLVSPQATEFTCS